tara:strand:- start:79 stop:1284 length:1206 start_codon:yes stop_codon:yes gene_type:complete
MNLDTGGHPFNCATFKVTRFGDAPKRITEKDPDQTLETNLGETVSTPTDAEAPTIHLPETLVSASHEIELIGKVTDQSAIESLTIDGEKIALGTNGTFSHLVYVPRRGSEIQVVALDERGNRAEKTVSITRAVTDEALFSFAKLDPRGVRAAKNHKAIALVIGIGEYSDAPDAPYADLDAEYFTDYAHLALGIPAQNIKFLVNNKARGVYVRRVMKRWLPVMIEQGKTDVYVFFAGHGLASRDGKDLYLLPEDGLPDLLEETSITRNEIYDVLTASAPRSVTVFLDTCFSGGTRGNETLVADARPILVTTKDDSAPEGFTVFAASSGNEISSSLPEAKHGLFSYFLMKGMEGGADSNADQQITAGELHAYISDNVSRQALRLGRVQTPQLQGNEERVLISW